MLLIANLAVIALLTICCILFIFRIRQQLNTSIIHTHIIIMVLSVVITLTIGSILGLIYGHDLVSSTVISTILGMAIGLILGQAFNFYVMLSGMVEGIMGGMIGAMIGMMLHHSANWAFFLFLINAIYIIIISLSIITINRDSIKPNHNRLLNSTNVKKSII
ncbi:hypothetical protein CU635_12905 [Bacillus canaveralius]|uniref:Uncharacterized protein n=1 Tax=Bacillus canaveralius TaxID=1403243 RepID=A0A2N5GKL6_9BACI|nr:hypothetical protein [Bacillus canaveralius]PLR82064.1 hypothetical protein CU635_12905 [Bacillus canaveralius]